MNVASAPWYYQTKSSVPMPAVFVLTTLADGTPVVAFSRTTRDAIVQGLAAQGWAANEVKGPAVTAIKPNGSLAIKALDGMRAAAQAGMNVFIDADVGLKVGQTGTTIPGTSVFVAVSPSVVIPPCPNPDDDAIVLGSVDDATRVVLLENPGMSYVLFARGGESF